MKNRKYRAKVVLMLAVFVIGAVVLNDANAKKRSSSYDNVPAGSSYSGASVISAGGSMERTYAALASQRLGLMKQADNLTAQMSGAKRSQVKKINKQLVAVNMELARIERMMSAYPRSITNPDYQGGSQMSDNLRHELDSIAKAKDIETNFDNIPITDDDPELQRAYRLYQQYGEAPPPAVSASKVMYRVQIATGLPGHKNSFQGINDIYEVNNGKGTSVYYSGSYNNYNAAQNACRNIRSTTRYKDAFVVAMDGDKRISTEEARKLLK